MLPYTAQLPRVTHLPFLPFEIDFSLPETSPHSMEHIYDL